MFYILSNVNGSGLHIFRSKSIRGPWEDTLNTLGKAARALGGKVKIELVPA
jgi:beta-xylosidase